MTKRWGSVRSDLISTKHEASKRARALGGADLAEHLKEYETERSMTWKPTDDMIERAAKAYRDLTGDPDNFPDWKSWTDEATGLLIEVQPAIAAEATAPLQAEIERLQAWAEDEQLGRHKAEEDRMDARSEIERLRNETEASMKEIHRLRMDLAEARAKALEEFRAVIIEASEVWDMLEIDGCDTERVQRSRAALRSLIPKPPEAT